MIRAETGPINARTALLQTRQVQGLARWLPWLWCVALPLLALGWLGITSPAHAGAVPGELPSLVGRLSTLQGDVHWFDRDSGQWLGSPQQPLRNWPLAEGDRLRTGANARAELRVGNTTVRLGPDTELTLQDLDEKGLVLQLQAGTVALRLADLAGRNLNRGDADEGNAIELITPEGRWLPMRPGHYRFDRQALARTPATLATVWRGELQFLGHDSALTIPAGRRADVWLDVGHRHDAGRTRYAWASVDRDVFADWVARDERHDDAPNTAQHVPASMAGWQDLDQHGDWVEIPEQGSVWLPRQVAPGWAPFQDGRWAWVAPWGWTWIDAAPWGFAPFHYGSWLIWQGRWGWSPGPNGRGGAWGRSDRMGPRDPREGHGQWGGHAVYAPALSAWIGGPLLGINIRIGGGGERGGDRGGEHADRGDRGDGRRPPPPQVVMPRGLVPPSPAMVQRPPVVVSPPQGPRQSEPSWGPQRDGREPAPRERDQRGPRDPREMAPREAGPRDPTPREMGPTRSAPLEMAPRATGPRVGAPRDGVPREAGPREPDGGAANRRQTPLAPPAVAPTPREPDVAPRKTEAPRATEAPRMTVAAPVVRPPKDAAPEARDTKDERRSAGPQNRGDRTDREQINDRERQNTR